MLIDRIIGAFTFRRGVYAEVEKDSSFTTTAWLLVVVVTFLNQLGSHASPNFFNWLISAVLGTITMVIGFALATAVISWTGRSLFNAEVTFDELVRTLGLASVWNIIGFAGALVGVFPLFACMTAPVFILGVVLLGVAWFIADQEALDLDWGQTLITVILGFIVWVLIWLLTRGALALMGLTARVLGGAIGL